MALTDIQVDAMWRAIVKKEGCQYLGPDQDPRVKWPMTPCGKPALDGKSYCAEHYPMMYKIGSSTSGKRKSKAIEREIKELEAGLELQTLIAEQEQDKETHYV